LSLGEVRSAGKPEPRHRQPILVDVIAPVPEHWGLCSSCRLMLDDAGLEQAAAGKKLDDLPPDWEEEHRQLSALILELAQRYHRSVVFRLFDPRSFRGLLKSIRHRIRSFPAFLVPCRKGGRRAILGADKASLEQALRESAAE